MRLLLLKAQFNLVPAGILKNHGVHLVPLGKWSELHGFFSSPYLWPSKCFLHHKYAKKGNYNEFAMQWSFVALLWTNEVGGTFKMNIDMALKWRSYILNLDHVKLSLPRTPQGPWEFSFSELLNEEIFTPAFKIYLYFCHKHTPKSWKFIVLPNFSFRNSSCVVCWSAI